MSLKKVMSAAAALELGIGGEEFHHLVEKAVENGQLERIELAATPNTDGTYALTASEPTACMVALPLPGYLQEMVAVPGGSDPSDLHVTLAYLGDVSSLSLAQQRSVIGVVGQLAMNTPELYGTIGGTGRFPQGDGTDAFWVGVQVDALAQIQQDLVGSLTAAGITVAAHPTFTPHITVMEIPSTAPDPAVTFGTTSINFHHIAAYFGGQCIKFDLQDGMDEPVQQSPGWAPQVINKSLETREEERYTLGPWYVPDLVDAHGDWTDVPEVQKSFRNYLQKDDHDIRLQHNRDVVAGRWVDGICWPTEYRTTLTKADGTQTEHVFPAGTPFLGVEWSEDVWPLVKAGKISGYSIGGSSRMMEIEFIGKAAAKTVNDHPDSDFAYIEPGGTKDADGMTVPRSLRHFPIYDAVHVRNALARVGQSPFGDKALPKIKAAAKRLGIA